MLKCFTLWDALGIVLTTSAVWALVEQHVAMAAGLGVAAAVAAVVSIRRA